MKKVLAILLISMFIMANSLFAKSLSVLSVENATMDQLVLMCSVRNLSIEGSKTELKNRLLELMMTDEDESEGDLLLSDTDPSSITGATIDEPINSNPYILKIISAQTLTKTGDEEPLIILEGSAQITFQTSEDEDPQKLSAAKIVVDLKHKRLSALGSVSFQSGQENAKENLQNIEGEIVSLDWSTQYIDVAGGSISTTRENSDGEDVTFTAFSKELSYNSDINSFILTHGYVTSNPDTSYSSITAEKLVLLPNGDMYLKNAYISIGRVPVLYLPYFYSPGATMIGNPSIGYESSRGLFVNTTWEIFGKYPSFDTTEQSSFSTLLDSDDDSVLYPTSSIYTSTDDISDLEKWATENNNYLTLMYDAYQYTPYRDDSDNVTSSTEYGTDDDVDDQAFAVGYATELNFFEDKLSIDSFSMFSFTSDGVDGDITDSSDFPEFRYAGEFDLNYDSDAIDVDLSMPMYSDPYALKAYANRLSSFSLSSLWNTDQNFPTTYSSDITSYDWTVNADIDVPTDIFGDYIQNFEISSIDADVEYTWEEVDGSYGYNVTSYTIPSIDTAINGELLNIEFGKKADETDDSTDEESSEDENAGLPFLLSEEGLETLKYENFDTDSVFAVLKENEEREIAETAAANALKEKFKIGEIDKLISTDESSSSSTTGSYWNISYTLENEYSHDVDSIEYDSDGDIDSYTEETTNEAEFDIDSVLNIKPDILKVSSSLDTYYSYQDKTDTTQEVTVETSNTVTVPFLGLSYYFNADLYDYEYNSSSTSITNDYFEWSDDWVTKHKVALSHEFEITDDVSITPIMSLQLPPLDLTLSPELQLDVFDFTDDLVLDVDIDGTFELESLTNTLKYSSGYYSAKLKTYYDFEDDDDYDSTWDPLKLTGSFTYSNTDISQKISESFTYYGEYDDIDNYFDSIKTTYSNDFLTTVLNFSTDADDDDDDGNDTEVTADYIKNTLEFDNLQRIWWKGRAGFDLDTKAIFNWDFRDEYSTYFSLETSLSFEIAEFLDVEFSITTSNYGFYNYFDDSGNFSFWSMLSDLINSFDVFGDGIYDTNFTLEDISLDFVHYMDDWDLHCTYSGSVVLSDYEYSWKPSVSIYLEWDTIPELTLDQTFSESDGSWSVDD